MTNENTFDRVKTLIVNILAVDEDKITKEANIIADLGADSLDLTEIIMACEEEFGVEIPDEDAENLEKVEEVVTYIDRLLKGE